VAGLRPDPLGELKRSPRPPSHNKGGLLLRGEEERGGEGMRKGRGNLLQGVRGIDAPAFKGMPKHILTPITCFRSQDPTPRIYPLPTGWVCIKLRVFLFFFYYDVESRPTHNLRA